MLTKTLTATDLAGRDAEEREKKGRAGEGAAVAGVREDATGDWETVGEIAARIVRGLKEMMPALIAPGAGHRAKRSAWETTAAIGRGDHAHVALSCG